MLHFDVNTEAEFVCVTHGATSLLILCLSTPGYSQQDKLPHPKRSAVHLRTARISGVERLGASGHGGNLNSG